jgi:4'-phosphopantetheinyl transferase
MSAAELWFTRVEPTVGEARLNPQRSLLSDEERARATRFVRAGDRVLFTVAHALVRSALSRAAAVAPADWRFQAGAHGRPRIAGPVVDDLDFNLAHSEGIAVCLVARGVALGVDVESLLRAAPLEVAERYFAPAEVAALARLPAARQPRRFFELWTLKEAYVKARGLGLTLPLDGFAFTLADGQPPRISFTGAIDDDARAWQFTQLMPTPQSLAAVALRPPAGERWRVVMRELMLLD